VSLKFVWCERVLQGNTDGNRQMSSNQSTVPEVPRKKRKINTRTVTQTIAFRLTPDTLATVLEGVPGQDWERT
jgi:hypothetical protein